MDDVEKWDPSILRSLTHSLQMPDISDIKVMTYANLIHSIFKNLPESFNVSDVENLLKKYYGFEDVSKLLISKALFEMSTAKYPSKNEITEFLKSDFSISKEERVSFFNEMSNDFHEKVSIHGIKLDGQQKVIINDLLECTLFELSESIQEVISSFYEERPLLSEYILEKIKVRWSKKIAKYGPGFIDKVDRVIAESIIVLKSYFSEKEKISEVLGTIGLIFICRSFICVDPELIKLEKEIFSKTFILLDTNIIIAYLCQGSLEHEEIYWLLENCKDIGIKLVYTNETVKEFERTLLKDNVRKSVLKATGEGDISFADRDIPMGYYQKWSKMGSWEKYMNYLEGGFDILSSKLNASLIEDSQSSQENLGTAYKRIEEAIRLDRYKEPKTISHDAYLILAGHKLREEYKGAPFPSFILTREKNLYKSENSLINNDKILFIPQMITNPDNLIEFLMPFFSVTVDQSKITSILGKILSNIVIKVDKKVIEYLAEYTKIEAKLGDSGSQRILDLALDEHISTNLLISKERLSSLEFNNQFIETIKASLEKLDESEQLKEKLLRLTKLAKTPKPRAQPIPKIQDSFMGKLCQLIETKLGIFCDPKPMNEKEFQREIYKLLRARDYQPNWDSDQVTFSNKGARPDFTFPEEKIAIEAKYIGEKISISKIVEEMAADTTLYSKEYDVIIFVIYDGISKISDVETFSRDFEEMGNIVIIIK